MPEFYQRAAIKVYNTTTYLCCMITSNDFVNGTGSHMDPIPKRQLEIELSLQIYGSKKNSLIQK